MMDTADPLCSISSTTCLLRRTLGGPAPAASPSKADEALLRGISATLKGSKELIEQSKIAMKEYGDIHTVYQDDGGKAVAAANCKNDQPGRRPGGERKRHRFTMRHPTNKALPSVDRSVLDSISDPDEYFAKELELDGAEAALKQLNGEGQAKITLNFDPVVEPKRRNSSRPRKSYSFSLDAHASSATMIPLSQSENMTEPLTSQDNAHTSVSEKIEQSTLSKSDKCAISDSLMEEDSFIEKDKDDEITNIMGSFQEYDGPDKVDFLRKKIGIGEIPMENIYRRDSVLGGLLGGTVGINLLDAHTLEGPLSRSHQARVSESKKHTQEKPLPGSHQARVSELVERIFRDSAMDSQSDLLKDDEFERPPEIVMREQSLPHDSSDQDLATDEIFSAREKDREAPSSSGQSAENVIDPEPNIQDSATVDDNPCSRHDISMEEDNMPMDHSTVDESNNEVIPSHPLDDASTEVLANTPGRNVASDDIAGTSHSAEDKIQHQEDNMPMDHSTVDESNNEVISSHPLDDASREVLANTPGRNVASDDIAGTSHSAEDNIQHQEVVEEDGVVQDKSVHSLEIPLEDIGPQNQSQAPDGTIKELAADLRNAPSLTKGKAQKASKRGKTKQQPKRGKKVPDESGHSLEQLQADFDSENQPHTHDANAEKLIADVRALSPTKEKTQKATQSGKNKQQPKRGKKVADESLHSLEIPQADFDSENQPHTANTETLIADVRAVSPTKEKTQKASQRAKNKQQLKRRKKVADESRHSLETPQADFDSENQPHTHDANAEKLVADARAVTPTKEKTQKATRRGKNKQQPKQGKKVADESCCSLEMPQTDLDTENQPHTHDVNSEQQTVMRNALSPNKSKGEKAQRRNRAHELNKRKSLADDGLEWQSGVRRSKRTRYRPLEQWRGERVLYGRIHETMVTVIGVKTYSPDKDGKAALKVKSFVPEQYSDIFTKSAKC